MLIFEAGVMSLAHAHAIAVPVWGRRRLEQIFSMGTRVVTEQYRGSDDMDTSTVHVSVLRDEVAAQLCMFDRGTYLDVTLGGGGHSAAILQRVPNASVVATDRDARALSRATEKLAEFSPRLEILKASFSELAATLDGRKFDGVIADLGISSDQLAEGRGFSFADSSPLDMRMDESEALSARQIVNEFDERELYATLRRGGVGSEARPIARAIVRTRPI